MTAVRRCEIVPLDEVYELSFELARRVRAAGFAPDLVVAIARGGFVPARLVCDFLCLRELASLGIRHYAPGARREPRARLRHPLASDPRGLRVLVVDDVNDSGGTIRAARAHLAELGAAEVRVGVLHEKLHSEVRADFRAAEVPDRRWLIYQWALVEDALGFLEQMDPPPATETESRKRLETEFGMRLEDPWWAKVLASMPPPAGDAPEPR